jgi:hypothetical protein
VGTWQNRLALKGGDPFAFPAITPLSHRRSLIWIKLGNTYFLRVLGAASMKDALEINGSLALAGNEVLEPGLELGQLPADAPQTNP